MIWPCQPFICNIKLFSFGTDILTYSSNILKAGILSVYFFARICICSWTVLYFSPTLTFQSLVIIWLTYKAHKINQILFGAECQPHSLNQKMCLFGLWQSFKKIPMESEMLKEVRVQENLNTTQVPSWLATQKCLYPSLLWQSVVIV